MNLNLQTILSSSFDKININIKQFGIVPLIRTYVCALILTFGRKNCSSMSRETSIPLGILYSFMSNADEINETLREYLLSEAVELGNATDSAALMIDFTQVHKPYAKEIDGLCRDYNGCTNRPEKGVSIGVIALHGNDMTIPFEFMRWVQKKIAGESYVKKTEIAKLLIKRFKKMLRFKFLLLDGAFANEDFLKYLTEQKIDFVLRIPSNRVVEIDGIKMQLRDHPSLKLKRKMKWHTAKGAYKGMPLFFTSHKRKGKNGKKEVVFIVSNVEMGAKEYIRWYKVRFVEEKFFRTGKQSLGLAQCQYLDEKKQDAHILAVFAAYTVLEKQKIDKCAKCPEDILHALRYYHRPPVPYESIDQIIH